MVNYALIKLGYLGRRLSFLLSSFYTKILHHSPFLHHFQHLIFFRKPYDTYSNPNAEQQYWDSAERGLRQLRLSDARFVGSDRPKNVRVPEMPPLVMYYVPALLPRYRDSDEKTISRKRRIKENSLHLDLEDYYRVAFSDSVRGFFSLQIYRNGSLFLYALPTRISPIKREVVIHIRLRKGFAHLQAKANPSCSQTGLVECSCQTQKRKSTMEAQKVIIAICPAHFSSLLLRIETVLVRTLELRKAYDRRKHSKRERTLYSIIVLNSRYIGVGYGSHC